MYCKKWRETFNNIKSVINKYDMVFNVIDSHTIEDLEFKYIPPHMYRFGDSTPLHIDDPCVQVLNKNTLSAIKNNHLYKLIKDSKPDEICVVGFVLSFDVLFTILDLIDQKLFVTTNSTCISDLDDKHYELTLNYLKWINVKDNNHV